MKFIDENEGIYSKSPDILETVSNSPNKKLITYRRVIIRKYQLFHI